MIIFATWPGSVFTSPAAMAFLHVIQQLGMDYYEVTDKIATVQGAHLPFHIRAAVSLPRIPSRAGRQTKIFVYAVQP